MRGGDPVMAGMAVAPVCAICLAAVGSILSCSRSFPQSHPAIFFRPCEHLTEIGAVPLLSRTVKRIAVSLRYSHPAYFSALVQFDDVHGWAFVFSSGFGSSLAGPRPLLGR